MKIKYDIDRVHSKKELFSRRSGNTVRAIMDVIGKIMVTDNETVVLVVKLRDRIRVTSDIFKDVCINHFNETPIMKHEDFWSIKGYSSNVKVISWYQFEQGGADGYSALPTFDVYELS